MGIGKKTQEEIDSRRSIKIELEVWQALKHREADSQRPLYLQIRDLVMAGQQAPFIEEPPPGGERGGAGEAPRRPRW